MAEQPTSVQGANPPHTTIRRSGGFTPPGQPLFRSFNRLGLWTLYMKEVRRFFKVQTQTIWAPAVTTLLYLMIFTLALGGGAAR